MGIGCHRPASTQFTPGKKKLQATLIHLGLEFQLLAKQQRYNQKTDTATVFFMAGMCSRTTRCFCVIILQPWSRIVIQETLEK
jgi:hypothetical protein